MQYYMVLLYSIIIPPRKKMGWNMVEQPFSRGYRMIICSGGFNTEAMWSMCSTGS